MYAHTNIVKNITLGNYLIGQPNFTSMKKRISLILMGVLFTVCLMAQRTVQGTITSPEGDALIGVNVIEKGTSNGTITDIDGNYSLVVGNNAILVMSYTGYEESTIDVLNASNFDLIMNEGALLDEVVVTALGIERKEKALPYSVTQLDGENATIAREVNVGNALAGKIAGVNVSNPATGAGGSTRIVIRGNSNINGNNQPLIVVDGVPINNQNLGSAGMWGGQDWGDGLSSINPDDIETYTVLKGNTAGALYGYRADNGVILITTKKGTKRKGIGVEFNSSYQTENIINNYDFQTQYGHGTRGVAPTSTEQALANGLFAWGGQLDGSMVPQFDGVSRPYSNSGDNLGRFYDTGSTFNNSLSFSGGGEDYGFRFSVTNLDNKGINPGSSVNKKTFTTNTYGTFGKFKASISGSYVNDDTKNRPRLSDSPGNANYTVWSLPASINVNDLKGTGEKRGANEDGTELQFNDNVFVTNPWWATDNFQANNRRDRLFGNIVLGYEIVEGLTLQGKAGIDRFNERRRDLTPYGTAFSSLGQLTEGNRELREVNLETTLRYLTDINENIGLDLLVGGNQQKNLDETIGGSGNNFNVPFLHTFKNLANQSVNYGFSKFQVNSLFGQAEISLWNQLYLTATGRQDWFSTLTNPNGEDSENSVFYSSLGVAYDLAGSNLGLPGFIDLGKVRASYATVGGTTDPYQLGLTYGIFGQGHLGNPLGGITNGSVPAQGLRPSTNTELELGFDVRLFQGRANLDFAWYNRTTKDGILSAAIDQTSGYGSKTVNVGEISNKGIELLLEFSPISSGKFNWDVGLNYARNINEVKSLLTPESDGEQIRLEGSRTNNAFIHLVEGLPYSQVMGFVYLRNDAGDLVLDDAGLPQSDTLRAFGTGVHPNSLGINNRVSFGNLSLSFLVDIKTGGKIYNATEAYGTFRGLTKQTLEGRETGLGNVAAADVQDYYQRIAFGISEEFIDDADFAKLREVILSYRLPNKLTTNLPFSSATLSFAARNLFVLWSKVDNIDPESTFSTGNAQGLEMFGVPVTRTYGLNLSVKF